MNKEQTLEKIEELELIIDSLVETFEYIADNCAYAAQEAICGLEIYNKLRKGKIK